jgi:hypothetical protein
MHAEQAEVDELTGQAHALAEKIEALGAKQGFDKREELGLLREELSIAMNQLEEVERRLLAGQGRQA